jgi:GT2 family glycosyltransferase
MKPKPSVGIVIPVFNRLELTIKCLNSLSEVTYPNFTIIIVDDASSDGTYEYLSLHHPDIVLVKGDGNQWYSGGMNAGIKKVFELNLDYILFLNNDNTVEPEFLGYLVEEALNQPNTICCSIVFYENEKTSVRFGGGTINNLTGIAKSFTTRQLKSFTREGTCYITKYAGGMGILVHKSHMKDIGLLDEKYFPMCGDHELWQRAIRKKNYRLCIVPRAIVYGSAGQGNIGRNPTIRNLMRSITDMRSGSYFKYVLVNYYRYFPKYLIPYYLISFYGFWIIGGLSLIFRKNINALWKSNQFEG